MNKEYMKPETVVTLLETATLLAGSIKTLNSDYKATSEDVVLTRRNFNVWGDDEEDE